MDGCKHTDSTKYFRSYEEALNLSEQDIAVAAPNAQPAGNRPGPATAHTHAPHESGKPAVSNDNSTTVKPGHTKGIKTKPTGANKNRLH